jgi:arylsulfatase A-like enzyme
MAVPASEDAAEEKNLRPNVLWLFIDDQDPRYGCYGEELVDTPNIDALAAAGVVFERTYVPTPVCAPTRSALMTGTYPIRTGTHNMRSSRDPSASIHLPEDMETLPELFRQAGYATFNRGKDDYNFVYDRSELYSIGVVPGLVNAVNWKGLSGQGDWSEVPKGTPFFAQIQPPGGKSTRGIAEKLAAFGADPVDPAAVAVPPQYPDIPEVRRKIADHLNTMQLTDHEVGRLLDRLKADGLWENTIIFLFSDHGSDLPRSKEFCYEEGLRVPLIIAAPGMTEAIKPGTRRSDLTSLMDVTATSLALAGLEIPEYMDSKNVFADDYSRDYVFSSRDRCSFTIDRIRSVRGDRYHYIRNFMTNRPLMQWNYRSTFPISKKIEAMYANGELTPAQALPYGERPPEELYDMRQDPHQTANLANDSAHRAVVERMRGVLADWITDTDDKGQYPESRVALQAVKNRFGDYARSPEFEGMGVTAAVAKGKSGKPSKKGDPSKNKGPTAVYPTRVYWGDTHVHTTLSGDAYAFGARLTPAEARRPLDFLMVADHAENLGVLPALMASEETIAATDEGKHWSAVLAELPSIAEILGAESVEVFNDGKAADGADYDIEASFQRPMWHEVIATAEKYNEPGRFTTFVGYEWSARSGAGPMIHRNVLFLDGPDRTRQVLPFSRFDSDDPEDLWAYLQDYEERTGGQVIAIPHNGNLSGGGMFPLTRYAGEPMTREYALARSRWEPIYEVTQIKGDGESHPMLSPDDEFAGFEPFSAYFGRKDSGSKGLTASSYARSALKLGLGQAAELGANPFGFGLIGSTDSHTALATANDDNFWGKMAITEPSRYRVASQWWYAASGYAAVWAQENTRASLFAAMKRREVYATTGPRMVVRFFAGWDFAAEDAAQPDLARAGYAGGVPMGGDLTKAPRGKPPSFLIAAQKDPDGANLDRVQVIKGWLEANGELHEKVYDVALSDGRTQDESGAVKPVGSTIDLDSASYTNEIGDVGFTVVWTDPDFDPAEQAFYYLRVLEIPTPRWTAYDAKSYGLRDLSEDIPMVTQERAYTSPIWYSPR